MLLFNMFTSKKLSLFSAISVAVITLFISRVSLCMLSRLTDSIGIPTGAFSKSVLKFVTRERYVFMCERAVSTLKNVSVWSFFRVWMTDGIYFCMLANELPCCPIIASSKFNYVIFDVSLLVLGSALRSVSFLSLGTPYREYLSLYTQSMCEIWKLS